MALESGVTYIEDLVSTNPVGATDNVDEGDDHIRNIKTAVQGSFPSLGATAVTKTAAQINDLATKTGSETLTNKTVSAAAYTGTQTGFTGNVTGNVTGSSGSCTGNSATATAFNSSRTITISGDASGTGASSNGTNTISISLAANSVNTNEIVAGAVQAETATSSVGAVGTYAMLWYTAGVVPGATIVANGSNLLYSNGGGLTGTATKPTGTWRCMGYNVNGTTPGESTMWLRIS